MAQLQDFIIKTEKIPVQFPPQHQPFQPGLEWVMVPRPISENPYYKGTTY